MQRVRPAARSNGSAIGSPQLLAYSSETRWIRYARTHLTGRFHATPQQSGYNKRLRAAGTLISATITALTKDTPSWHDVLRLVDSTPLPCGLSREPSNARAFLIAKTYAA